MPQVRPSVPGPKMICFDCFYLFGPDLPLDIAKAIVGFAYHFRPTYAEANCCKTSCSYWSLLQH